MYNYNGMYPCAFPSYGNNRAEQALSYWVRSFFQRATAIFEFDGLPENWDIDAFKYGLYMIGYLCGFQSERYGLVIQPCTLTGIGLQYQPTHAVVNTPYFQFSRPLQIGNECELIKLTPDYTGIYDLILKYADQMKELDLAFIIGARSSRASYAAFAANDKAAKSLKALKERVENGEDIIIDTALAKTLPKSGEEINPFFQFDKDLKQNFILPELEQLRRDVIRDFYREIGVSTVPEKKERLITDEAIASENEPFIRRKVWEAALNDSLHKFNEHYKTNITVKFNTPEIEANDYVS